MNNKYNFKTINKKYVVGIGKPEVTIKEEAERFVGIGKVKINTTNTTTEIEVGWGYDKDISKFEIEDSVKQRLLDEVDRCIVEM